MAPLKVLIIGGGIAGPALAYWLARLDANITLIERSPNMRASGQQVDIRAQGIPMMQKMGIETAVRAASVPEPGVQLIDTNGQTKAYFPAVKHESGKKQSITSEFEIMRGDLVRILYRLTENCPNVKHLFSTTVISFAQDDERDSNGKVHVKFHDGREEDFDLVVGADGTGSKTRKMMLGPEAPDPRHSLGGYIGYFSVPSKPGDSDRFTMCHLPGPRVSRIIATRKDRADVLRIYMLLHGKDAAVDVAYRSGNLAEQKKAWADLYQGGGWQCDRFMDDLLHSPEADDLYYTPCEEVRLPQGQWSKGRVVLVGDAAHSETAGGFGTTWGLIAAYIFAGEVASRRAKGMSPTETVMQAARAYEEEFRPVSTAKHGGSEWFENITNPRSRWGIRILHAFARVAAYVRLDQSIGFDGKTDKWQLPEYSELSREQA